MTKDKRQKLVRLKIAQAMFHAGVIRDKARKAGKRRERMDVVLAHLEQARTEFRVGR